MKVRLLMALHFHQPVGNFDHVFEEAVRQSYEPLVSHFERHPGVRAGFHLSGCLLEWLERHDPRLLDRVVTLVGRGQIEPLGGGFYEPILTVFSREDGVEQIERLAAYWEKRAGVRPTGAWLAERVWEQGLCETLAEAGVAYTILDDQHLRFAGLLDERFSGAFSTERAGRRLSFFPSDFQLRYLIPFRTLDAVREHFEKLAASDTEWALTYGDDAEKFGLWPGTHKWVYEEKWLEQFFTLLEDERAPVTTGLLGEDLARNPPRRKVYVPDASYTEMLEWALYPEAVAEYARVREAAGRGTDSESVRAFVRGSLWDTFLARYPESDQLHKHVLWTSRRTLRTQADGDTRETARTAALRAQCNCAYWHGLFGGVYLPHLRHGVYAAALEADALLAKNLEGVAVERTDLDGDGHEEVIVRSKSLQAFFKPADAGTLVELDYLPARFNVANTISRWKEAYHEGADIARTGDSTAAVASPHEKNVALSAEQRSRLFFDALPLRSLREFRCRAVPTPEELGRLAGLDPASGPLMQWRALPDGFEGAARIGALHHRKRLTLDGDGALRVRYESAADCGDDCGQFGVLLYFTLLAADASDRRLIVFSERGEESGAPARAVGAERAERARFVDEAFGFALTVAPGAPCVLRAVPVETLQRTEKDYETLYQGTLLGLFWPAKGLKHGFELSLVFEDLEGRKP